MTHSKVVESVDKAVLDIPTDTVDKFEVHGDIAAGSSAPGGYAVVENGSNNWPRCAIV